MKKKILKYMAVTMGAVTMLSACSIGGKNIRLTTGLSDNEVFKIDGSAVTVKEAKLYLTTEKNLYEEAFGDEIWDKKIGDITFEDYVKDGVKSRLAEIKSKNLLADKEKIKLNDKEVSQAKAYAKKYYDGLSKAEIKYMGIKEEDVVKAYKANMLADKVYNELVKDVNPEISDADAKVIKVATIYKKTYMMDGKGKRTEYTDEEKAETKKEIDSLYEDIMNGEDFMTLANEETDADMVEYQFGKGEMIKEFEDSAYALSVGEVSKVVETEDGYYIIKCISDYMSEETQANKEKMIQEAKEEKFQEIYKPFVDSKSSEFNSNSWNKIKFSDMKDVKVSNFYDCMVEDAEVE